MFTDLEGFTSRTQRDEAGALRALEQQERLIEPILRARRGRKVKSTGDGFLVEFPDALDAIDGAVELQRAVREHNTREGGEPLRVRVGIHLGDVQERDGDIFGDAVNIASRIEPLAEAGGISLSAQVFDQVRNKVAYRLERVGPRRLKGVDGSVEVYRVVLPWLRDEAETAATALPRLAILPLTNISPDPNDEYFADGLTEELISTVSQVRGLRVISRTSVSPYKASPKPVAQIGSELGVTSILEGSVRKFGDRLRITVQLIDVPTDEHRWSQTFDRKMDDVFAIQAEVAERTAGAMQVELLSSERAHLRERPTSNLAAYENYLRGIQAFQRTTVDLTPESDESAVRFFEAAIRDDPRFASAYSALASHLILVSGLTRPAREVFSRARELAAKALALNPRLSDAHVARANVAMQADLDWETAEAEFREGIALAPSSSSAHLWYGFLLSVLQRFPEAKAENAMAVELDPLWFYPRLQQAMTFVRTGETDTAIALCEKLSAPAGGPFEVPFLLAGLYAAVGRDDEARRIVEPLRGSELLLPRLSRAAVLTFLGEPEEARALLERWERGTLGGYFNAGGAATLYALLGDREHALELLDRDFREGDRVLWNVYQDVSFDLLRDDPRFVAMLRALRLPTTVARPLRPEGPERRERSTDPPGPGGAHR